MIRKSSIFTLLSLLPLITYTQGFPRFTDKTNFFKRNVSTFSTLPGVITDINGDLIDDIVALDKGYILRPAYGVISNVPFLPGDTAVARFIVPEFSMVCSDFDFDGYPDIASFGGSGVGNIFYQKQAGWSRSNIQVPFIAQTANIVDINGDNTLELFICNDDGPNLLLEISENGFSAETGLFNFATIPASDMSGNYGSDWADVNGDGLMDLAIAKCRAGITDPNDPRRVNRLFISDGNGKYMDQAAEYGFDSGHQSWAVSFCDMDNDGDQDVFVVNHYAPCQLYENVNGVFFKELDFPARPENVIDFQVAWKDFDNDGYPDLLLSGTQGIDIYKNNGLNRFILSNQNSGIMPGVSAVCGDINDDGFIDIHAHHVKLLNFPGSIPDRMYVNEGNSNHFIKFSLRGKSTNTLGIGAKVNVFVNGNVQTRTVKSGESYGVSHSTQLHFGLGTADKIDSVQVVWPAGYSQWIYDLQCQRTYFIEEGKCVTEHLKLFTEELFLDPEKTLFLEAPAGMSSYFWNRKLGNQINEITSPGQYFVEMIDQEGCRHISKPVRVLSSCIDQNTDILGDRYLYLCSNEKINISSIPAKSYLWSNGDTSRIIEVKGNQFLGIEVRDACANIVRDTIEVISTDIHTEDLNDMEIIEGDSVLLSSGDALYAWYIDTLEAPIAVESVFLTGPLYKDTIYYYRKTEKLESAKVSVGLKNIPEGGQFGSNNVSGSMIMEIQRPLTLHELKVMTDKPGLRKLLLRNSSGKLIYDKEFYLESGINTLFLNWNLEKGNYVIRTDSFTNIGQFGHVSPRLARNFENGIPYPFEINDVIKIPISSGGLSYYYYFYDMKVSYTVKNCYGQFEDVLIKIKSTGVENSSVLFPVSMYPNPADQLLNIILEELPEDGKIIIFDAMGRQVLVLPVENRMTISTAFWPRGLYHLELVYNGRTITQKIIKF